MVHEPQIELSDKAKKMFDELRLVSPLPVTVPDSPKPGL
jgi:hypothetical protein